MKILFFLFIFDKIKYCTKINKCTYLYNNKLNTLLNNNTKQTEGHDNSYNFTINNISNVKQHFDNFCLINKLYNKKINEIEKVNLIRKNNINFNNINNIDFNNISNIEFI